MKHINAEFCPRCDQFLLEADEQLRAFARRFRSAHTDGHISCAYRSDAQQLAAVESGHSKALPGQSKHNTKPARALDWFRLTQAGGASFDSVWFKDVLAPAARNAGLVWGGDWKSFKDMPHVELSTKPKN